MPLIDNYLLNNYAIDGPSKGMVSGPSGEYSVGSNATVRTASSSAYAKMKSVRVNYPGVYRFEQAFGLAAPGKARLYVNGVARGSIVQLTVNGQVFSQTVTVEAGDTIELWGISDSTAYTISTQGNANLYSTIEPVTTWIL
ncbi:hypothetical protein [Paenibacillus sp. 7516]|uniref:hypothetical protein n=1 Tax=Paenibacillus sp. 7516 TaxID=2022549 RepID=UPI000BA53A56|nr:hypothetical protein [Paenibacillus sp. 7516]PAF31535.1 hypothetical protein CHI14_13580 [Paenibacillus sp. 7516]